MNRNRLSIAVMGSGMAGAAAAHELAREGHAVHVFDKARGPGGRLATRRVEWVDRQGQARMTPLDHGAWGFTASDPAFQAWVDRALGMGWLAEWKPKLAPGSQPLKGGSLAYVSAPDMPALCRHLLEGVGLSVSFAVDGLHRGLQGWQLQAGGVRHDTSFDAVLLALPPPQAAPLLNPHRPDWASEASSVLMEPCWTLMGMAHDAAPDSAWDLAQPPSGPLAWVLRNDARPGRASVRGQAHWVAHARPDWSREHLEQPPAWVQQQLQAALAACVGRPIDWLHGKVHRWRYALPPTDAPASAAPFWWDPDQGLGVCGDFLGGRGVEGAWLSAQALSAALLQSARGAPLPGSATRQRGPLRNANKPSLISLHFQTRNTP